MVIIDSMLRTRDQITLFSARPSYCAFFSSAVSWLIKTGQDRIGLMFRLIVCDGDDRFTETLSKMYSLQKSANG